MFVRNMQIHDLLVVTKEDPLREIVGNKSIHAYD